MTSPTPDNFNFAAMYDEDPAAAVALTDLLLLDPNAINRRSRYLRAVRALPGWKDKHADFEPEIDLVVNVGLASEEGSRKLAEPDAVERVSRMLDDPDALAEAHRRLVTFVPPETPKPWPAEEEIADEVGRVMGEHRDKLDLTNSADKATLLDKVRDRLYSSGEAPRSELVRFYEVAGLELDRRPRSRPVDRGTPMGTSARQLADWERRAAAALRLKRSDTPGFGRAYVLLKYAHRSPEQIAHLLDLSVAGVEELIQRETAELVAVTPR